MKRSRELSMKRIEANLIDIHTRETYGASIVINGQRITSITRNDKTYDRYVCPGLIDAHVHIESSMLIPSEFARQAVQHGCVATVSDPHEIANVLGMDGINFMIEDGNHVPFKFYWTAPSCVPATQFESSGAHLNASDLEPVIAHEQVVALGEMMNFPGVIYDDAAVGAKLAIAKKYGKPIDGHIPGVHGADLEKYVMSGISTDHECVTLAEAKEKIRLGMKILIREGSAARNFHSLHSLIATDTQEIMLCTDDSHPDELLERGNINKIIKMGLAKGHSLYNLLRCCTLHPVEHYTLDVGLLRVGDPADFIVIDNPESFSVLATYIDGEVVYENGQTAFSRQSNAPVNIFRTTKITLASIRLEKQGRKVRVIEAIDGELLTNSFTAELPVEDNCIVTDVVCDILKIVVLNRYDEKAQPVVGFIKGFNLKKGAIATSIAHDSHNIIAVGVHDQDIVSAVNEIIDARGGMSVVGEGICKTLPLEYAGLMTATKGEKVANQYNAINQQTKSFGCTLSAPFMTLSFMALLVIPSLKIGDKGLFDGDRFQLTSVFAGEPFFTPCDDMQ